MPKKKSTFTDQTQPPYFRLDAQQYKTYSARAEQRVKDLIAAAPPHMAYTSAAICGKALTRAVVHQPDPDPPAYYDPDTDFDDESDAEAEPPADRYQPFRSLTAGWTGNDALDIGLVRTLYHLDLFASDAYNEDVMDKGGFPYSPHATIPRRISPFGDILHPPDHGKDWLIYDLFLGDALARLVAAGLVNPEGLNRQAGASLYSLAPPDTDGKDVTRTVGEDYTSFVGGSVRTAFGSHDAWHGGALGKSALACWQALRVCPGLTVAEVVGRTGKTRPTVKRALTGLEHHGLARADDGEWEALEVSPDALDRIALELGTLGKAAERVERHQGERARYATAMIEKQKREWQRRRR